MSAGLAATQIRQAIEAVPVVDTHEHLRPPASLGPINLTRLIANTSSASRTSS